MNTTTLATVVKSITLNRAHKVVQRLKELIKTEGDGLGSDYTATVYGTEAGKRQLAENKIEAQKAMDKSTDVLDLIQMLGNVRQTIAVANHQFGVTALMNEESVVSAKVTFLEEQTAYMTSGISEEEYQRQNQDVEEKHRKAVEHARVASQPMPADSMQRWTVSFLTEAKKKEFTEGLEILKARRIEIADNIADANLNKVDLVLPEKYIKNLLGS